MKSDMIRIGGDAAAQDIGDQIGQALQRHAEREAKHIEIKVREGTVARTGKVDSEAGRSAGRGAAWSAGGHAVVGNLTVG